MLALLYPFDGIHLYRHLALNFCLLEDFWSQIWFQCDWSDHIFCFFLVQSWNFVLFYEFVHFFQVVHGSQIGVWLNNQKRTLRRSSSKFCLPQPLKISSPFGLLNSIMLVGKKKCLMKAKKKVVAPFSKNIGMMWKHQLFWENTGHENSRNQNWIWLPHTCISEVNLADLQNDEVAFRKFNLITEDVQGKNYLTSFHGIDLPVTKRAPWSKQW